jgi:8-oxo-dGTP pyrophosphatase MutT (NUDIX family)
LSWIGKARLGAAAFVLRRPRLNRLAHGFLPKKRLAAGVLLVDQKGRLLVVKPSYRDCWLIPGGLVEKDEPPWEAAWRETEEEVGLKLDPASLHLKAIDWCPPNAGYDESLHFIFDGGAILPEMQREIMVDGMEIVEHRFIEIMTALPMLEPPLAMRVRTCFEHPGPGLLLLQGGREPG